MSTPPRSSDESLYQEIAAECDAMVRHALGCGRSVLPQTVEIVAAALAQANDNKPSIAELTKAHRKLAMIVAPDASAPVKAVADHIRATFEVFRDTGKF